MRDFISVTLGQLWRPAPARDLRHLAYTGTGDTTRDSSVFVAHCLDVEAPHYEHQMRRKLCKSVDDLTLEGICD